MKKLSLFLAVALALSLLTGCAGTPVVYYSDCTCPTGSHGAEEMPTEQPEPLPEGAVKTGMYIASSISGSKNAADGENGQVNYDVTLVAVNVDDSGIITGCVIDSLGATAGFDATGMLAGSYPVSLQTKNELGESYGMVAGGGAIAEWDAQAAALADYAVGKTVDELKKGAVGETGYAQDADLASSATIYLGGYVQAIEQAAANAQHLGARSGDELRLAVIAELDGGAGQDTGSAVELTLDAAALTVKEGIITSACIDSVQAQVRIDGAGAITAALDTHFATKNQKGESYGMVAWGGAIAEWDAQAASFCAYITGKTPAEVAGIAVTEATKPADADLAASVTVAIGGFQALIAKAFAQ